MSLLLMIWTTRVRVSLPQVFLLLISSVKCVRNPWFLNEIDGGEPFYRVLTILIAVTHDHFRLVLRENARVVEANWLNEKPGKVDGVRSMDARIILPVTSRSTNALSENLARNVGASLFVKERMMLDASYAYLRVVSQLSQRIP
jgi:hypothetical protein